MKKALFSIVLLVCLSCSDDAADSSEPCQNNVGPVVGAKCKDGSTSGSTGSGTCSGHGGVDYWLCNYK